MRQITSKEEFAKKRKRNQIIVGLVLVGVMIVSSLGYAFQSQDNTNTPSNKIAYKGFEFENQQGLWFVEVEDIQLGKIQFAFSYAPTQVERISEQVNLFGNYLGKPLYINSEDFNAESEIYRNLDRFVERRQYACLNNSDKDCDTALPVKTCENNFIIIEKNNVASITQDQNCVFIRAPQEDLAKTTDEFLFKIIGVD